MAKAAAPDPVIGVWILSVAHSTFRLLPPPTSSVLRIEAWEDGLKVSVDTIDNQRNRVRPQTAYKFDGKDYPLTGTQIADTVSSKRIDQLITESRWKKGGTVVLTIKTVVSADGNTLTATRIGVGSQGRTAQDVMVYDRYRSEDNRVQP
jgi:hypothetical protein